MTNIFLNILYVYTYIYISRLRVLTSQKYTISARKAKNLNVSTAGQEEGSATWLLPMRTIQVGRSATLKEKGRHDDTAHQGAATQLLPKDIYIYICIHTHIYIYMHIHVHIYIYIYIHIYAYI